MSSQPRYSYAEQGFTLWRLGSVTHTPDRCGCLACADAREWMGVPPLPGMLPAGRWSRDHAACVACAGTEHPHAAQGLCKRCYHRQSKARRRDERRRAS